MAKGSGHRHHSNLNSGGVRNPFWGRSELDTFASEQLSRSASDNVEQPYLLCSNVSRLPGLGLPIAMVQSTSSPDPP